MKTPWSKEIVENITEICEKWIKGGLTAQDIRDNIGNLNWAVSDLIPEPAGTKHASSSLDILIDDIMEMDSISDKEKDKAIMELYEIDKEELSDLAKKVIEQIEINDREFREEAYKRGYCSILTKEQ